MVLGFNVEHVSKRDKACACVLASVLLLGLGCATVVSMIGIVNSTSNPPTATTFHDGQENENGLPRWGRMPYLLARTQKENGTIICPPISDVFFSDSSLGVKAEPTFHSLSLPTCASINAAAVLIDLTMLVPLFPSISQHGEIPLPPTIDIRFVVTASDGVDLFFAPPDTPPETFQPPWQGSFYWISYIGGIGDISNEDGQYARTDIEKQIQPKKGAFWGFNPFYHHIEDKFRFIFSGYSRKRVPLYTRSNTSGVNFGWRVTIPSSIMMVRKPDSIVVQFVQLIGKAGGWVTICTAVFYMLFWRKYPLSHEEQISARLALAWRAEQNRVDFNETSFAPPPQT